eukprot:TRINITY_DN4070_c0_g1_i1.p1 TRINITY_DN4070_c0_g1~~TRINITY_DN4070_c0_g1_i1.p1  ORF type:complete len:673 (-),score=256.53 TRINITY_DN4070_c0_g1_i1:44-1975(-)
MAQPNVQAFFVELDAKIKSGDYEDVVSISDNILKVTDDKDAIRCKIVALIHLGKFDQALTVFNQKPGLTEDLQYERAYALYRQKKLSEALAVLDKVPDSPNKTQLLAQVLFRDEQFSEASKIYSQLTSNLDATSPELAANALAAMVSSGGDSLKIISSAKGKSYIQSNHEFAFNAAYYALEQGDIGTAEKYLKQAISSCQKSMKQEGASEADLAIELAPLQTQLGYVYQLEGKSDEASQLYASVLKAKPSDEVYAVASNNTVVIKKDSDKSASLQRLKQATSNKEKLNAAQRKLVEFNKGLILVSMGKQDQAREVIKSLETEFGTGSDLVALLESSILFKNGQIAESQELLQKYVQKNPKNSNLRLMLSLAQIQLEKGDVQSAIRILESIPERNQKAGIVATLVTLYDKLEDVQGAVKIMDEHTQWLDSQKDNSSENSTKFLKQCAAFQLKHGNYKEAASAYEKVLKKNPKDIDAIPGLIVAYSHYDPKQAQKFSSRLPELEGQTSVDAEQLEKIAIPRENQVAVETKGSENSGKKEEKRKRKKKRPQPKDMTKPLDPERWLPLHMRSTFRARRKKTKGLEKGAQGGVAVGKSVKDEKAEQKNLPEIKATTAAPISPAPHVKEIKDDKPAAAKKKQNKGKKKR